MVRLLGGTALTINGHRPDRVRQTRRQPGVAGHIRRLLARLRYAATNDQPDLCGVDAGALDSLDLHGAEQVGGVET